MEQYQTTSQIYLQNSFEIDLNKDKSSVSEGLISNKIEEMELYQDRIATIEGKQEYSADAKKVQEATNNKQKRISRRNITGKGVSYREEANDCFDEDDGEIELLPKKMKKERRRRGRHQKHNGRNPWTSNEDDILRRLVAQHGSKWSVISNLMAGARTGKQIRDRYVNKLDNCIMEKPWSSEEDCTVIKFWQDFGNKWSEIAKQLPGRTESMVKNRFYSHIKKRRIGRKGQIIEEIKGVKIETNRSEQSNEVISSKQPSLGNISSDAYSNAVTRIQSNVGSGVIIEQGSEDLIVYQSKGETKVECSLEEKPAKSEYKYQAESQMNYVDPSMMDLALKFDQGLDCIYSKNLFNPRDDKYNTLNTQLSSEPMKIEARVSVDNLNSITDIKHDWAPVNNSLNGTQANFSYQNEELKSQPNNLTSDLPFIFQNHSNIVLRRLEDEMLDMEEEANIERSMFMLEGRAGSNDPDMNPYWKFKKSQRALIQRINASYEQLMPDSFSMSQNPR